MGYEDEMQEYHEEMSNQSQYYYQLKVPAGMYTSDNIFSLMWELCCHRFNHLIKHGRWID